MNEPTTKRCSKCCKVKELAEFHRQSRSRDGLHPYCKVCNLAQSAEYLKANRNELLARRAAYREANRDEIRKRHAALREVDGESRVKEAAYRAANRDEIRAREVEYRAANKDKRRRQATEWRTANPNYHRWVNMLNRCENPEAAGYKNYGGRGVAVCAEWHDCGVFVAWIEDNLGMCPEGCSLDRIDNDGDYEPGNVRWASVSEQNRNRRSIAKR